MNNEKIDDSADEHDFKVGDVVRITEAGVLENTEWYAAGDKCTLVQQEEDGMWWGDFKGHNNPKVVGAGVWCIGDAHDDFERVKP